MKSILTLFIVGTLSVAGRADTDAVLRGIRIVETRDQLHPPRGKLGERGPYQFRRDTWRMHTSANFALAENREVANTVARRHYAWLESQLASGGVEPSPYNVAVAWNAGLNAVLHGTIPSVSRDYAVRVLNLAAEFAVAAKPREEWKAPVVFTEEEAAGAAPAQTPAEVDSVVTSATTAEPFTTSTATADTSICVRYYADPILLALNRTAPTAAPEPRVTVADTASSEALLATAGRM